MARPHIFPFRLSLAAAGFILMVLCVQSPAVGQSSTDAQPSDAAQKITDDSQRKSIERQTGVHRLSTTKRAPYDAFVYVNRIPEKSADGETAEDFAGRIFGRLANQEGRILLKLPSGMDRQGYLGFKTFLRYEGQASVGNCAACHTPAEFTDLKTHIGTKGGGSKPTPSLRNLKTRGVDVRQAIMAKMAASRDKRSGSANEIADPYAAMSITAEDVPRLVAFLKLLNDVPNKEFRNLILDAKLLDTSQDIDGKNDSRHHGGGERR